MTNREKFLALGNIRAYADTDSVKEEAKHD